MSEELGKITAEEFFKLKNISECGELTDGVVVETPGCRSSKHQVVFGEIFFQIKKHLYENKWRDRVLFSPFDVKLSDDNVVKPDIFVSCQLERINEHYHDGAPDWVIEIVSPSSISRDYVKKLKLYRKTGVKEYWVVNPIDESVSVYVFDGSTDNMEVYSFSDNIPVNIYKESGNPLEINIEEYI